jgi:hypothetical protein
MVRQQIRNGVRVQEVTSTGDDVLGKKIQESKNDEGRDGERDQFSLGWSWWFTEGRSERNRGNGRCYHLVPRAEDGELSDVGGSTVSGSSPSESDPPEVIGFPAPLSKSQR